MKANDAGAWRMAAPIAICTAALAFAVRSGSLWIDEGQTWSVISRPWAEMIRAVFGRGDAVSGMPLYFLCEAAWCRVFGYSEFAMRSMNYIFAALAVAGSVRLVSALRLPPWTLPLFVLNSVFLYYANEARPYAAMYACGAWCLFFLLRDPLGPARRDLAAFACCYWIGCALHMMFAFMGVAYLALAAMRARRGPLDIRMHLGVWLRAMPFFLALGIHYLRFVFSAPEVGNGGANPVAGIVQIAYSFANLGGIGWSRNDLRAMNLIFNWRIAVGLAFAALSAIALSACAVRAKAWRCRPLREVAVCSCAAMAAFLAANVVMKTRFWERHAIYLMPAFCAVAALACREVLAAGRSRRHALAVGAFIAVNAASGLSCMALGYYGKDDYKGAVAAARALSPRHVFFQGDANTFRYYGLEGEWGPELDSSGAPVSGNVNISGADAAAVRRLLARTEGGAVLILSEKAEFDSGGLYRKAGAGARVNTFSVFSAPGSPDTMSEK